MMNSTKEKLLAQAKLLADPEYREIVQRFAEDPTMGGPGINKRSRRGEPRDKLTLKDAMVMRELHAHAPIRQVDLARLFGVSQTTVCRVLRGEQWRTTTTTPSESTTSSTTEENTR